MKVSFEQAEQAYNEILDKLIFIDTSIDLPDLKENIAWDHIDSLATAALSKLGWTLDEYEAEKSKRNEEWIKSLEFHSQRKVR